MTIALRPDELKAMFFPGGVNDLPRLNKLFSGLNLRAGESVLETLAKSATRGDGSFDVGAYERALLMAIAQVTSGMDPDLVRRTYPIRADAPPPGSGDDPPPGGTAKGADDAGTGGQSRSSDDPPANTGAEKRRDQDFRDWMGRIRGFARVLGGGDPAYARDLATWKRKGVSDNLIQEAGAIWSRERRIFLDEQDALFAESESGQPSDDPPPTANNPPPDGLGDSGDTANPPPGDREKSAGQSSIVKFGAVAAALALMGGIGR